jgi:hypothetical protein
MAYAATARLNKLGAGFDDLKGGTSLFERKGTCPHCGEGLRDRNACFSCKRRIDLPVVGGSGLLSNLKDKKNERATRLTSSNFSESRSSEGFSLAAIFAKALQWIAG